ncbi:MAG: hypothetical protein FJ362_04140 [Gemmatimonadetes bacterium]|nr:hypothetical protein [Gemmatimonadota bacterium]
MRSVCGAFLTVVVVASAIGLAPRDGAAQITPDSIRPYLVFRPVDESWFVAANRGKRMLLDIGRVDLEVRKDSAVATAYRTAVAERSPITVGTTFQLRGPWGSEAVTAQAVDTWNGRIVLVLQGSAVMDSLAQRTATVVASVTTAKGPNASACVREPLTADEKKRVQVVRDSLVKVLRAAGLPPYPRLASRVTSASSEVAGCFDRATIALVVSLRTPTLEWTRQRLVLIDAKGMVRAVPLEDFRLKVHDLLHALDADGDGVDDLAAIGRTERGGATSILRFDRAARRFTRLASGFAWEDR